MKKKTKLKTIEDYKKQIEKTVDKYMEIAEEIMKAKNKGIVMADFYIYGGINRTLDITESFLLLLNEKHFQSAGALLRLHLDTLLRLYALRLVESPSDFVKDIMDGKRFDKLKDKDNHFLTDAYLREKFFNDPLNQHLNMLVKVYEETSGFIHFSDKHIYSQFINAKDGNIQIQISSKLDTPEKSKKEILGAFLTISYAHISYLNGWRDLKNYENK